MDKYVASLPNDSIRYEKGNRVLRKPNDLRTGDLFLLAGPGDSDSSEVYQYLTPGTWQLVGRIAGRNIGDDGDYVPYTEAELDALKKEGNERRVNPNTSGWNPDVVLLRQSAPQDVKTIESEWMRVHKPQDHSLIDARDMFAHQFREVMGRTAKSADFKK